jgi:hypothetical protein
MSGAAVGIAMNVFHSGASAVLLEAAWLGAMYALARTIFANRSRKRKNTLRLLTEELAEQVRESVVAADARALPAGRLPSLMP